MFVYIVRWRRVGPWRLRTVLRPVLLRSLESNFDYLTVIYLPGKRICCLGGCSYIAAFLSDMPSTSGIERGTTPRMHRVHMWHPSSLKKPKGTKKTQARSSASLTGHKSPLGHAISFACPSTTCDGPLLVHKSPNLPAGQPLWT
jgi:hypothetical protein